MLISILTLAVAGRIQGMCYRAKAKYAVQTLVLIQELTQEERVGIVYNAALKKACRT
jgi:3-deoxy-D-manno-octulosonic acid (KDO) 8-phosphate synthase